MIELYQNIISKLRANAARFTELGIEPISTVDLYNGQPENPEAFEFTTPALFIDYGIDWERGGSGYKSGIATIDIHILADKRPGTENWSNRIDDGIKRLLYHSLIGEILESVGSPFTGSLCLINEKPKQTDYFDYHILTFDTSITRPKDLQLLTVENVKAQINAEPDKI